jgi:hypothetical protein
MKQHGKEQGMMGSGKVFEDRLGGFTLGLDWNSLLLSDPLLCFAIDDVSANGSSAFLSAVTV